MESKYICCAAYQTDPKSVEILNELGKKQYARWCCQYCGHFLRWGMNPKTQLTIDNRRRQINYLLQDKKENLSETELEFLQTISTLKYISPKQTIWYSNIL